MGPRENQWRIHGPPLGIGWSGLVWARAPTKLPFNLALQLLKLFGNRYKNLRTYCWFSSDMVRYKRACRFPYPNVTKLYWNRLRLSERSAKLRLSHTKPFGFDSLVVDHPWVTEKDRSTMYEVLILLGQFPTKTLRQNIGGIHFFYLYYSLANSLEPKNESDFSVQYPKMVY